MHLQLDNVFNNGNYYKFRAFDHHTPVGFSQIRRNPSCSAEYPPQCKNHIYYELDSQYRGKGLGKQLLSLTIVEAQKIVIGNIRISCLSNNIPSLNTIKRLGLRFIDSYKPKNSEDRLLIFTI